MSQRVKNIELGEWGSLRAVNKFKVPAFFHRQKVFFQKAGFLAGIVITDLVSLILVAAYLGAWIGIAYLAVSILSGLLVMKAIVTAQQRRYVLPGIPLTDEQGSNAMVTCSPK